MSDDRNVDSTIAKVVTTLSRRLQDESKRRRIPRGFNSTVTRASAPKNNDTDNSASHDPESEHTERIFFAAGLQALLAYYFASSGYGRHHPGQQEEKVAVQIIKKLPTVHQQLIAAQIAKVDIPSNIFSLINRLSESPSKRRRLNEIETSHTLKSSEQHESSSSDLRSPIPNIMHSDALNGIQVANGLHRTGALNSTRIVTGTNDNLTASDSTQEVTSPPAKNLPKVFPNHICRAVRKMGDKAAIVMAFPYTWNRTSFCLTTLSIQANKVANFAMVLFGIHIECEDGSRYVLVNGVKVQADDLFIQGVKWEVVPEFFGLDCSNGVERCPERQKEVEEGEERTACVTMRITNRANDDALLNLSIAMDVGYELKEVLFGG